MNNDLNDAMIKQAVSIQALIYVLAGSVFSFGFIVKIISENCGV